MIDTRHTLADYYKMAADDNTITRHEQVRLREAVIEGTLDADDQTDVQLVGLPNNIEVVAAIGMVNETATTTWDVYDSRAANDALDSFRLLINFANPKRQIRFAEVGASLQGSPYRVWIKYIERL